MMMIDSLTAAMPRSIFDATGLLSGGAIEGREEARETIHSGFRAVDALMPAGGLRRGNLVEWLAGNDFSTGDEAASAGGAVSLALAIACQLAKPGSIATSGPQSILVVDRGGWFYPPAVMPWLGDAQRLIVARPSNDADEIWTIDQALRCSGLAAVVAWPRGVMGRSAWSSKHSTARAHIKHEYSRPSSSWTTAMRRWQLAARSSGCIGLFIRPATAARESSWAESRIAVSPMPDSTLHSRRLRLERVGGAWNGGLAGRAIEMVLDLARGTEETIPRETIPSIAWPRLRERVTGMSRSTERKRGISCRAS